MIKGKRPRKPEKKLPKGKSPNTVNRPKNFTVTKEEPKVAETVQPKKEEPVQAPRKAPRPKTSVDNTPRKAPRPKPAPKKEVIETKSAPQLTEAQKLRMPRKKAPRPKAPAPKKDGIDEAIDLVNQKKVVKRENNVVNLNKVQEKKAAAKPKFINTANKEVKPIQKTVKSASTMVNETPKVPEEKMITLTEDQLKTVVSDAIEGVMSNFVSKEEVATVVIGTLQKLAVHDNEPKEIVIQEKSKKKETIFDKLFGRRK